MTEHNPGNNVFRFPLERTQSPLLALAARNAIHYGRPVAFDAPAVAAHIATIFALQKQDTTAFRIAVAGIENDLHESWDALRFIQPLYVQAISNANDAPELITYRGVMSDIVFEEMVANWDAYMNQELDDDPVSQGDFVPYLQLINTHRIAADTNTETPIALAQIPFSAIVGIYEQD